MAKVQYKKKYKRNKWLLIFLFLILIFLVVYILNDHGIINHTWTIEENFISVKDWIVNKFNQIGG